MVSVLLAFGNNLYAIEENPIGTVNVFGEAFLILKL